MAYDQIRVAIVDAGVTGDTAFEQRRAGSRRKGLASRLLHDFEEATPQADPRRPRRIEPAIVSTSEEASKWAGAGFIFFLTSAMLQEAIEISERGEARVVLMTMEPFALLRAIPNLSGVLVIGKRWASPKVCTEIVFES